MDEKKIARINELYHKSKKEGLSEEELKVFQEVAKSVWTQVEEQMGSESYQKLIDFVMEYQSKK